MRKKERGEMVGLAGIEPATSRLSGVRSNRLSYRPPMGKRPLYTTHPPFQGGGCHVNEIWVTPRLFPGF